MNARARARAWPTMEGTMYAIVCTKERDNILFYGPFNSEDQAERYARKHKMWGLCLIVQLHDSGNALDTK